MPSQGLVRALESLRLDEQVTAEDIRRILGDIRKEVKRKSRKVTVPAPPRVKVLESKFTMYRRKIEKLEDLWVSAERRAQAATIHLDTIREAAATVESTAKDQNLLRLLQVIETETDALRLNCKTLKNSTHDGRREPFARLQELHLELDAMIPIFLKK